MRGRDCMADSWTERTDDRSEVIPAILRIRLGAVRTVLRILGPRTDAQHQTRRLRTPMAPLHLGPRRGEQAVPLRELDRGAPAYLHLEPSAGHHQHEIVRA